MLLSVSKAEVVHLVPSLLVVWTDDYDESTALWGIQRKIPDNGIPTFVLLLAMDFASNNHFYGHLSEKIETYVTGMTSILQKDMDKHTYQESLLGNEGAYCINSHELSLINTYGAKNMIILKVPIVISMVVCKAVHVLTESLNL